MEIAKNKKKRMQTNTTLIDTNRLEKSSDRSLMGKLLFLMIFLFASLGLSTCTKNSLQGLEQAKSLLSSGYSQESYELAKEIILENKSCMQAYDAFIDSYLEWSTVEWDQKDFDKSISEFVFFLIEHIEFLHNDTTLYFRAIEEIYELGYWWEIDGIPPIIDLCEQEMEYYRTQSDTEMVAKVATIAINNCPDENARQEFFLRIALEAVNNRFMEKVADKVVEMTKPNVQSITSLAKMLLRQIWIACLSYQEKTGNCPPISLDIFGSGAIPDGVLIEPPLGKRYFQYHILQDCTIKATPIPEVDSRLEKVTPLLINKDGNFEGGL